MSNRKLSATLEQYAGFSFHQVFDLVGKSFTSPVVAHFLGFLISLIIIKYIHELISTTRHVDFHFFRSLKRHCGKEGYA